MTPRLAIPEDAADLARIHVRAWAETYAGLLPPDEIARRDEAARRAQWQAAIGRGGTRIVILPGRGFAQAGPQRDAALAAQGWPDELYALYLLADAQGQGLGRVLLRAALGPAARPFSALVIAGNVRASAFYARCGGRVLTERNEHVGMTAIVEAVYVWDDPRMV